MPHDSIQVGKLEVIPLCDGWAPLPLADELPGREVDWTAERAKFPWAFAGKGSWAWHVHAFAVRSAKGIVLIDSGIGTYGTPLYDVSGRIEDELAAEGIDPANVSHVVYTHLHSDHAGGACTPSGRSRFPNAVHDVHEADWRFFAASDDPEDFSGYGALSRLYEGGGVQLAMEDGMIAPGVTAEHTPGHTPGHRSVFVQDDGERLLLTGDLLHVPTQVAHPDWLSNHDEDPALACASRISLLAQASEERWRVGVSHFGRPFGTVGSGGWSGA